MPIRDNEEFYKHVKKVGFRLYEEASSMRTRNKKKTQGKLSGFNVALCVILLKERKPLVQVLSKSTTSSTSIDCSNNKKRKSADHFVFPARKFCIMLHSPLETIVKKPKGMAEAIRRTGLQKGKVVVEILYDLNNHIQKKDLDSSSESSSISLQEDANVSTLAWNIFVNHYLRL